MCICSIEKVAAFFTFDLATCGTHLTHGGPNRKICQDSKIDKRKPDQETVAASDKDFESKKCQGPRLPRDHAVDGRASQAAIPIGSPFSLQKGTPWECTFLLIFKTATTLKFKLQIKLCSCPLGSMYCLKKCPDTIAAEYAR